MIDISKLWDIAIGWTKQNSSLVLTGIAVGGTVSTAVLAFRAGQEIAYRNDGRRDLHWRDVLRDEWPVFIPPLASAGLTIASIICAHKVNVRKQAAVATALAISERSLHEYKDKVAEVISRRKANQIEEEVVQERIDKRPPWDSEVNPILEGNQLCYDTFTGRYFQSSRQALDNAVNMLNNQLNNHVYGSLNDFYGFVGLDSVQAGDDLGWHSDKLLEVYYSSHLDPNGVPCLALYFETQPKPNFYRGWN